MTPSRRSIIAVTVFALVLPTAITLPYFVLLAEHSVLLRQLSYGIGKFVQFVLPVFWIFFVLRRPFAITKLKLDRWLLISTLFGIAAFLATIVIYQLFFVGSSILEPLREEALVKTQALGVSSLSGYILLGVFYALFHSLLEEYYWRWFVFGTLRSLMNLRAAVLVSSIGFTAHHIIVLSVYFGISSLVTWALALCITVGGIIWALLYHYSKSIYGVWLSHAFIDAAIFAVGYLMLSSLLT